MKKTLLTLATVACVGAFNADATWVKLTSQSELKAGVDYVIVCEKNNSAMSATPTLNSFQLPYRTPVSVEIVDHTIATMPEGAAKIQLEAMGENIYALHQTNPDNSGYIYPASASRNSLGLSTSPSPNKIKIMTAEEAAAQADDSGKSGFTEGDAVITSTIQSERNILGIMINDFQYEQQNDKGLSFYYDNTQTGAEFVIPKFTRDADSGDDELGIVYLSFENATNPAVEAEDDDWLTTTLNGEKITNPGSSYRFSNNQIAFSFKPALTTPGTYVMTFREGFFSMKNSAGQKILSPELTYTYVIKETNITYSADPANNSAVTEISSVSFTFNDISSCKLSGNASIDDIKVYKDGTVITTPSVRSDKNPVILYYQNALTEAGTYTFTIAEGTFDLTLPNGNVTPSPAITYTLKIKEEENPVAWTSEPGNGGVVKEFDGLTITFPNASTVALNPSASPSITKEGESEAITSNFLISENGNSVTVNLGKGITYEMGDGTYTFSFPAGTFTINGDQPSTDISVTFEVNSALVEGANVMDYYIGGYPEQYVPLELEQSDYGMSEVFIDFSEVLTINKGCNDPIVLTYNGKEIASIAASNNYNNPTFAEITEGGAFGGSSKSSLYLNFGYEERFDEGAYSVKIPNGFFLCGDEILNGTTLKYSIGIGTFNPANGSTVSLKENISGIVLNKSLIAVRLTPYYSDVVSYNENQSVIATLTTERNGEKVVAGKFDSKDVTMNKGEIVFNLRQFGNTAVEYDGEYTLEFPANFFVINETTPIASTYSITFTLEDGKDPYAPEQIYKLLVEPGEYRPYPTVEIEYEGCSSISVKEGAQAGLYYGSTSTTAKYFFNISAEGNVVTFTPVSDITEAPASDLTVLVLKVPADSYTLTYNGKAYANEEVKISDYKIKPLVAPDMTLDIIKDGELTVSASDIKIITVDFSNDPITGAGSLKYLRLKNDKGTEIARYTPSYNKTTNILTLKCRAADEAVLDELPVGNYTFAADASLYYLSVTENGKTTRLNSVAQTFPFYYAGKKEVVPVFEFTPSDDAEGEITYDEENNVYEGTFTTIKSSVDINIVIPEGYDKAYYMEVEIADGSLRKADAEFVPADEVLQEMPLTEGNVITVPNDSKSHRYFVMFGQGDNIDTNIENAAQLGATVTYPVAVETIDAEEDAVFYNVNGLKVVNPAKGIYVKVVNGKTTKVVIK